MSGPPISLSQLDARDADLALGGEHQQHRRGSGGREVEPARQVTRRDRTLTQARQDLIVELAPPPVLRRRHAGLRSGAEIARTMPDANGACSRACRVEGHYATAERTGGETLDARALGTRSAPTDERDQPPQRASPAREHGRVGCDADACGGSELSGNRRGEGGDGAA